MLLLLCFLIAAECFFFVECIVVVVDVGEMVVGHGMARNSRQGAGSVTRKTVQRHGNNRQHKHTYIKTHIMYLHIHV